MRCKRFGIFLLIISLSLIASGIFIGYISSPKKIISQAMKNLSNSISYYETSKKIENQEKTNNSVDITIYSHIKLTTGSTYLENLATEDINYQNYSNLIKNLNNLETDINFSQSLKEEKLLFSIDTSYYKAPYLNRKFLIKDATEYKYISLLKDNYINNGTNNYFEELKKNNYNNLTLRDTLITSITNSIDKSNFKTTKEVVEINSKRIKANKISLEIDNTNATKIFSSLRKELNQNAYLEIIGLKDDITNLCNSIPKYFKDKKIIFNIYADKFITKNYKYELIYIDSQNELILSYSPIDMTGYLLKNNQLQYNFNVRTSTDNLQIDILENNNRKVGSIIFDQTENNKGLEFNFDNNSINIISSYYDDTTILKKDYSNRLKQFSLRATNKKTDIINLNVKINSTITKKATIKEDVSNSIFKSSITDEENEIYNLQRTEMLNKLYQ